MKNYKHIFAAVLAILLGLTSCVNDLNVVPKDENLKMDVDRNAFFNKIYATFALTGQKGPDGNGDVDGIDEGVSALYRMLFELNEFPADGGWWNWSADDGVSQIYNLTWNSSNSLVAGLYYRLYFDVTLCNQFLASFSEPVAGETEAERAQREEQCAEVRWIRAFNNLCILDLFQNVPYTEVVTSESPKQITRAELYEKVEAELLALVDLLPETKVNAYRVDKSAAHFLLMRLYLNAEIYTGTAQWQKAADEAEIVMGKYELSPVYAEMFMGDNNKLENPTACKEFVFSIYQDGNWTRSWGGSRFLVCATRDAGMLPFGSDDSWSCWRSTITLVRAWFNDNDAKAITQTAKTAGYDFADEYAMPKLAGDDRCMLSASCCNDGTGKATYEIDLTNAVNNFPKVAGGSGETFDACWGICKWTGVKKNETLSHDPSFPDTDIPLLRASEAWLTYAEAQFRLGQKAPALAKIKELRDRSHAAELTELTEDILLEEWQREFYCEGRRRTDLVRFDKFTTADRLWEGKTEAVEDRYNVYPIPKADEVANENVENYLGY